MKYAYDLHIHSALSPCASNDMTPNNIINMSLLKGLDIIAVTDHNSMENVPALMKCASKAGILLIPGIELETSEEVHVICLFPAIEAAFSFKESIHPYLPTLENREDIFGRQLIMDEEDTVTEKEKRLLIGATALSIDAAVKLASSVGGTAIPAHVDRDSYSILSNLGSIPGQLGLKYLEISTQCHRATFQNSHQGLSQYEFLLSSDAHTLGDILERQSFLELEDRNADCLIQKLQLKP